MNVFFDVLAGFLTTGDSHAPGNNGILDLVAALHWLSDNIEAFGGDPKQVTLFGHGHGASIVSILIASPVTKGHLDLFPPPKHTISNLISNMSSVILKLK